MFIRPREVIFLNSLTILIPHKSGACLYLVTYLHICHLPVSNQLSTCDKTFPPANLFRVTMSCQFLTSASIKIPEIPYRRRGKFKFSSNMHYFSPEISAIPVDSVCKYLVCAYVLKSAITIATLSI